MVGLVIVFTAGVGKRQMRTIVMNTVRLSSCSPKYAALIFII